ncbi:aldehyde dehydrogenase family protein [Seonamhaeicola maritimus]|uniref:Aldehyde dehydrogenase n=1 Tax=Seonamhaeicola maritimus TaxID=2591822 RepID=A0A5C7GI61_9FLAO|nr:aldehyde dehydrogenase family protein [Seonamhaeicola maritimus]TXG37294.1 aldehyde dehydrogenase [Seonamhaeicola maritimus]
MIEYTAKVKSFLSQDPIPFLIGGSWQKSSENQVFDVENPSDQSLLGKVSRANANDTVKAVERADEAFNSWKKVSPKERAALLYKLADLCERDAEELAQLEALDVGKSVNNARGFDVPFGIESLRYYASLIENKAFEKSLHLDGVSGKSVRLPYGVVAFIFPWNFPLTLCMWGIGPALAAGNTVVIKPAAVTPLSTLYLGALAQEAGFPDGVVNIVPARGADAGDVLTSHPKVKCLSFTGSSEVGKTIGQNCGFNLKPAKLELGGKGAAVVFDDADLDNAATGLAGAITLNTGQVCCTATRWIIHESVMESFVEKVKDVLSKTNVAPGMDEASEMGPVVSEKQLNSIFNYIEKGKTEGAQVILGGNRINVDGLKGYYMAPTLLQGTEENICFEEEIFGPVAYITSFKDEADAIRQVNSLDYGLANSVWTEDAVRAERVAKEMVAGNSWINAHNVFAYGLPYGGVNGSGNGGGVNSVETLFDYTRSLSIAQPVLVEELV